MSILTRLTSQHLDDAALAEIWTNAAAEGTRAAHPHLDACAECRLRMASLDGWLDDIRQDAIAEADEIFTAERLAAQQAAVARRLEAAERPSRVILFPKATSAAARPVPVHRWVAGSLAAGLVIGLGLGQLVHFDGEPGTARFPADRVSATSRPAGTAQGIVPASLSDDDEFLEYEEVLAPRYEALRAYDTFTPRAADFIQTAR